MKKTYFILLADRKQAIYFLVTGRAVMKKDILLDPSVPQRVKHGDDTWDAQDKIYRHIEDHLHRHLTKVADNAKKFVDGEKFDGVVIGGHKQLFSKLIEHLPPKISQQVVATFTAELKVPDNAILEKAESVIRSVEMKE
ncbi:MAG TPA: hypothetical protein VG935_02455 [Patescibacteria group bacterium]|nr:hypothetical protein [Patescibacteria group bacterium]